MSTKLAALSLLLPALMTAAAVEGTVKDPSGAAIPAAVVTAKNPATSQTQTAETDSQGHFIFTNMPAGDYQLSVQHAGFEPDSENIAVRDARLSLSITLKVAIAPKLYRTASTQEPPEGVKE